MHHDAGLVRDAALHAAQEHINTHGAAGRTRRERRTLLAADRRNFHGHADAGRNFQPPYLSAKSQTLHHVAAERIENECRSADVARAREGLKIGNGAVDDGAGCGNPLAALIAAFVRGSLAHPFKAHGGRCGIRAGGRLGILCDGR